MHGFNGMILSLFATILLVGCSGGMKSFTSSESEGHSLGSVDPGGGGGGGGGGGTPGTILFTKSTQALVSELADTKNMTITLTSDNYSGPIDVKIVMPELDAIDIKDGIQVSVSPATVSLTPGSSVSVNVTVNIKSTAPTAAAEHFHVMAAQAGTAVVVAETEVNLTVMPIFRIKVGGLGDATWMVNGKAINTLFNSSTVARGIDFVHHTAGVAVIFENTSGVSRQIHSSGPIPHQGAMMAAGASYTPAAVIGTAKATSGVYLHNDEAGTAARTLVFNSEM